MAANKGLYHHDFNNWVVNMGGFTINRGVTSVEIAYNSDQTSSTVGVDGTVTRNRMNDESATVTLTLQHTSPVNDTMLDLYYADRNAPNGLPVPLSVTNPQTGHRFFAEFSWIQDRADLSLEAETTDRVWVIATNCLREEQPATGIEYRSAAGPLGQ